MILKVFTGKLRALTALSASTVSVASVSTSSVLSSDTRGSAVEVLSSAVNTVVSNASDLTNTYVVEPAKNVGEKYKGVAEGVKEAASVEKLKEIGEKYKTFGTTAAELVKKYAMPPEEGKADERLITEKNFETVNYYVFQYASATIALINQAKSLIIDTLTAVAKDQSGKSTAGLISIQKIQQIVKSSETMGIVSDFLESYNKFRTQIDGMEGKHIHDAIKIIFSPETGNMVEVLKKLKENMSKIKDKNSSDIKDTDEFFKKVFIDEDPDKKIKEGATQAKTLVEDTTVENLLKDIEGVSELLENLKTTLGAIAGTPQAAAAPSESP